ncbi:MAG: TonB-dependent receptor [Azospirillaceae bacterium]|nr:TonB-dependent receptor [Azospirillaceae bacterium]
MAATSLACPLLAPTLALAAAADNSSDGLEEIVVTATRREEKLSQVPASVAAFTQEKMDVQGVRDIDDIARLTPGLNFTRQNYFTGSNTNISIRGIQSDVGAATTGIYVDDVPIQVRALGFSSANTYPKIFDLQRVEVLRGPQGTLFGAGAEGGAVRFITPQPDLEKYSGYARSEVAFTDGGDPSYEMGAAVGGPIVQDKLAFRASAWYRRDGGWVDRDDPATGATQQANANYQTSKAGKLALTWAPTENIRVTPSLYYQDVYTNDTSGYWEQLSNPGDGQYRTGYTLQQPAHDRYYLPSLTVNADFDGFSLTAVTAYFDRNEHETRDYTNFDAELIGTPYVTLPGQHAPGYFQDKQDNFSQEVRLQSTGSGPFTWVAGAYYGHEHQVSTQLNQDHYMNTLIENATGGLYDVASWYGVPYLAGDYLYDSRTESTTEQIAGFGQVDYAITDALKATVGVRVAHIRLTHSQEAAGPFAGGTIDESGASTETPVTPKFGLTYQVDPDSMVYATASKGFRPGGAQTAVPASFCGADLTSLGLTKSPTTYDSDTTWSYELGTKNSLLGGRVQTELSGYWINWSNVQRSIYLSKCGSSYITNAGSITSKGMDLSVQGKVTHNLTLGVVLGYNDATFDQTVLGGSGAVLADKGEAAYTGPKFTMTISGQYDFTLSDRYDGYARIDYSYAGPSPQQDTQIYSYDPMLTVAPDISTINIRTGVKVDGTDVSFFVNNLTNTHPSLGAFHQFYGSPLLTNSTLRPRTMGLTATYRY